MATVLVVDDDQAIREVVCLVLIGEGHHVLEATDGARGLEAVRAATEPMVVLLDDLMPQLSGMEVLAEVARVPAMAARHRYILMTGSARMFSAETAPELASLNVLVVPKPFDIAELTQTVRTAAAGLSPT